jgi:hypothetical protein
MHKVKRGDNNKGFYLPHGVAITPTQEELDAFDQLGPIARQAMRDSPIKWSAAAILQQVRDEEARIRATLPDGQKELFIGFDLQNPDFDRNIARGVAMQSIQIVAQDRSKEDALASIVPLRPRKLRRAYR